MTIESGVRGTKKQFETIAELVRTSGGWIGNIKPSAFQNVIELSIEHDDQRDGRWTSKYLIGEDGGRISIK